MRKQKGHVLVCNPESRSFTPVYAPCWFVEKEDLPVLVLVIVRGVCVRGERGESGEKEVRARSTTVRSEIGDPLPFMATLGLAICN